MMTLDLAKDTKFQMETCVLITSKMVTLRTSFAQTMDSLLKTDGIFWHFTQATTIRLCFIRGFILTAIMKLLQNLELGIRMIVDR